MASSSNVNYSVASASNCEFDPQLFKAATEGNIKPFIETNKDLSLIVTPTKNTVLHTHIMSLKQTKKSADFVKQILGICPSLLLQVNANWDTPLHVAVRLWNSEPPELLVLVEVLIECSKSQKVDLESGLEVTKQMLLMTNKEGNTALHEAVRSAPLDVVKILTKEAPEISYAANYSGETPLFIAAAEGYDDAAVAEILDTCKSAAHGGPDGKTALHAAVRANNSAAVKKILEKRKYLTKETDQNGWTPLHYAAYYGRSLRIVEQILEWVNIIQYTCDLA